MKSLICRLPRWLGGGHRKGKRIANTETIECPRCRGTWHRPLPKKEAASA